MSDILSVKTEKELLKKIRTHVRKCHMTTGNPD